MNWSATDWVVLFVPLVTGFGSSLICPIKRDTAACVKSLPPSYAFGIVWTILYVMIGLSWVFSRQQENGPITDILLAITVTLLFSWVLVYGCGKNRRKMALYTLLLINMFNFATWNFLSSQSVLSGCLFAPYVVWCLFAMYLNAQELECAK